MKIYESDGFSIGNETIPKGEKFIIAESLEDLIDEVTGEQDGDEEPAKLSLDDLVNELVKEKEQDKEEASYNSESVYDDESKEYKPLGNISKEIIKPSYKIEDIDLNQPEAKKLVQILDKYGEDLSQLLHIDTSDWETNDVVQVNQYLKELRPFQQATAEFKGWGKVDPYAMSKIDLNLWPEKFQDRANKLLHSGTKWWDYEIPETQRPGGDLFPDETTKYYEEKEDQSSLVDLFNSTVYYFQNHNDLETKKKHMRFLEEYSENNSVNNIKDGIIVIIKTKDGKYQLAPINKAKEMNAKGEATIMLVQPANIQRPMSFLPTAGKRVMKPGSSKYHMAGGLMDGLLSLFKIPMLKTSDNVSWDTIIELEKPVDKFRKLSEAHGKYLPSWPNDELLTIYRMIIDILPKPSGDNPPYPNLTIFEKAFENGYAYPQQAFLATKDLNRMEFPELYIYHHKDNPKRTKVTSEKIDSKNWEYIGRVTEEMELGRIFDDLAVVTSVLEQAKLMESTREAYITKPVEIMVNGNRIKLGVGDKLLLDNVRTFTFNQR